MRTDPSPRRLPVLLDLTGKRVLVVGGGAVAVRRGRALADVGAALVVVAPRIDTGLAELATVTEQRTFVPGDLDGAWLVVAATDNSDANAHIAALAADRQLWCLRSDLASESDAWLPAAGKVDDVTIAVSAGGDPGQARAVRDLVVTALRDGRLHARRTRRRPYGRVVLLGGGPGDPELMTLRGHRALLDADVVVADRLAPTGLLDQLPADVEIVDVGKQPRQPSSSQDDINALLIDRARAGSLVVRLKGGDPYVLGRGSEELAACVAAGVEVEVIPGLSSAVAGPTLAGIPLTERGTTQAFTVVSGHVPPGDERSDIDWSALGTGSSTLVLLMAVANLEPIATALVAAGRAASTPVAVIENASLPAQRVVTATLATLAEVAADKRVAAPAIVVIGQVVGLRPAP